ncbi:MAG: hypothetical protein ACTSRS_04305 [Candidatus Helarchaeota archaeon]
MSRTGTYDEIDVKSLVKIINLVEEFSKKHLAIHKQSVFERMRHQLDSTKQDSSARKLLVKKILNRLKSILQREIRPNIFLLLGGHGGIILNDIGYCEFDAPHFAITRLLERMRFALEMGMPYNIEIALSCLEWVNQHYPKLFLEFKQLFKKGPFEIINPSYTQPYSLIISGESNIKQFEYGLRVLKELELEGTIYYASECSVHPQIPQILKDFGIQKGSLRTRLLGRTPTSQSGRITWVGLDGTAIDTITDIGGVFNGEYWHGTFLQELPSLLFQAVAKPFLKNLVYSSIEDFVMSLPYLEEIWKISRFQELFGHFVLCSEIFSLITRNGTQQFNRDAFALGNYIFFASDLFYYNKECESQIISAEILHSVLGLFNIPSEDEFFEKMWTQLLLCQAHDCYAVPFIRPGDYSAQQLSKEDYIQLQFPKEGPPISELAVQILKNTILECRTFLEKGLAALVRYVGTEKEENEQIITLFVFNPSPFQRRDIIEIPLADESPTNKKLQDNERLLVYQIKKAKLKFIAELPPLGYKIFTLSEEDKRPFPSPEFLFEIHLLADTQTISVSYKGEAVFKLKFHSNTQYHLSLETHMQTQIEDRFIFKGVVNTQEFSLEIVQYHSINRLEFNLKANSLKEIIIIPAIQVTKSIVNYPFGIEETKRTQIQTLDFLWLLGPSKGILVLVKNSQQFFIERTKFILRNQIRRNGRFYFAICITEPNTTHSEVYNLVNSFQFGLMGIKLDRTYTFPEQAGSFLSISPSVTLINLWRRRDGTYLRLFNPTAVSQSVALSGALIKGKLKRITLKYQEIEEIKEVPLKMKPWKISTLKISE